MKEENKYTFEDYKNLINKTNDTKRINFILAELSVIEMILVEKGFISHEDFKKKVDEMTEEIMKIQYKNMSDDEKSMAYNIKKLGDLFGLK